MSKKYNFSVDEAKKIQSDVMKLAHKLKSGARITSEDIFVAWDLYTEKHWPSHSSSELRSAAVGASSTKAVKPPPKSSEPQLPLLLGDVPDTLAEIKNRFEKKLTELELQMAKEVDAAIKAAEIAKKKKARKKQLYAGKWVYASTCSISGKYRVRGRGSKNTRGGALHIMYHEDRKLVNKVAQRIDRIIDFVLENETSGGDA